MSAAIEVENVSRIFAISKGRESAAGGSAGQSQQVVALDQVSMSVERGEVRGLLGPNGAGKTTLVKILSTVLLPTAGRACVFGRDVVGSPAWVRQRIGVVLGGERGLYGRLSVRQNLRYWATLYGLGRDGGRVRVEELIGQFGLAQFADVSVDRISRGMKQRVHLARGILSHPQLLFLDEPTIGMDPVASREFHRMFARLRSDGTTILLTTHDMAEAEQLCDRVTLIDHGHVLGTESPREVGRWITAYERVEARIADPQLVATISDMPGVVAAEDLDDGWVRISTDSADSVLPVLRAVVQAGITAVRVTRPSLQDVYLELIGERGMSV